MEDTSSRIIITENNGKTLINIKSHNSIQHAFFIFLIISAIFIALVIIFAMLAAAFTHGFMIAVLSFSLSAASVVYKAAAVLLALRSVLWSLAGGEVIEINEKEMKYTKKIAGMGHSVVIKLNEVLDIAVIDYIREKDVIHMIQTELGLNGRSFLLKTASKQLKFGVYISMDDSEIIEKILKQHVALQKL